MSLNPGPVVAGPLKTVDTADTYGTHEDTYGIGGFRCVANIAARDAIPAARRKAGMEVYILDAGGGVAAKHRLDANLTSWTNITPASAADLATEISNRTTQYNSLVSSVNTEATARTSGDAANAATITQLVADLLSTANAKGASKIGVQDSRDLFAGGDVESVLAALATRGTQSKSANYNVVSQDNGKRIIGTASLTLTLPDAVAILKDGWYCYVSPQAGAVVTIAAFAGNTINGLSSVKVGGGGRVMLFCDGTTALRMFWLGNSVEPATVASAATVDIRRDVIGSRVALITGTTNITAITQELGGDSIMVFQAAAQITRGASLLLDYGASVTTATNDVARVIGTSAGVVTVNFSQYDTLAKLTLAGQKLETITSSGTWTKDARATWIELELQAAGGGSGGVGGSGTNNSSSASSGSYLKIMLPASYFPSSAAVTIGAAGLAGANNANGGQGGDTSFIGGSMSLTVNGGPGGIAANSGTSAAAPAQPTAPTKGQIRLQGEAGSLGSTTGFGGGTVYGVGGAATPSGSGPGSSPAATAYGAGAGGSRGVTSAQPGAAGIQGVIVVRSILSVP